MMDMVQKPSNRLLVVAGIVTVLMAFTLSLILLLPGRSLAQDGQPVETLGPVPVPALNPPIQTPRPGEVAPAPAAKTTDLDVEVLQFRPTERLERGQGVMPSPSVEKPAGEENGEVAKPASAEGAGPPEAYSAPDYAQALAPLDWVELLYEGFVGFSPPGVGPGFPFAPAFGDSFWTVYDFGPDGFERTWGANDWISYYHDDNPSDNQSGWPAAFGEDALNPNFSYYGNDLNSWLDYGPVDLSNMDDAFVSFGLWYRTELDFDKIKFCVSTNGLNYSCNFWSGDSGGWTDQAFWLTSYAGNSQVWLAWVFQSDFSNVSDGPFVDEISLFGHEVGAPPPPTPTPDPSGELVLNGSFESGDLTDWQTGLVLPSGIRNGGFERGPDGSWTEFSTHGWDVIVDSFTGSVAPHNGSWAAWLGGEHDEVSSVTQEVTIPADSPVLSYWHWIASEDVCGYFFDRGEVVINGSTVDVFELCAGNNTGGWVRRAVDLSAYIDQTVELQIRSETDSSLNSNLFIDDVRLGSSLLAWEGPESAASASAPGPGTLAQPKRESGLTPDSPGGNLEAPQLLKDARGSSPPAPESSLQAQQASEGFPVSDLLGIQGPLDTLAVGVSDMSQVHGTYAAYMVRSGFGVDSLYQTLNVPAGATDLVLNLWFGVATFETKVGYDWLCMNLADPTDHTMILVDLGCIDATDAAPYWQELIYGLDTAEMAAVTGQSVDLTFYLFSDFDLQGLGEPGAGPTTVWIDYVRAYATGAGGGQAIDPNEPNDDVGSATLIACNSTIDTGVIGDALGGYDEDWFRLDNVSLNHVITIDIDARTQVPPSALDSVVHLFHANDLVNRVAWNDDDGASFDSFLTYTNTLASNATFYIKVQSYSGYSSPDSFYDLTVDCAATGGGAPPTTEPPPTDDAWTVMLYLNAEDPSFAPILTQYRRDIEAFIGSKSSFLNVVILYDGPGDNNTTRFLVQPGGAYTNGTNRWPMGELNMGHPDTLENFVTWAMDQYPADHYYLAVDDHGDGAYGISWDPSSGNDQLTPAELYSALKSATLNGARKIDIFDYEACLMGLAENAYDLREWVDYVVFFEQISWGIDTYPQYFRDLAENDTALDVGWRIVDRYYAGAYNAGFPHTISLINTSRMEAVRDAVTNFGSHIMATDTRTQKDTINAARGSSQAFAADMDATDPRRAEYIDLWDLADNASGMATSQAAVLKSAVDAAVVHERHASGGVGGFIWNHDGAHGLSIYYPPSKSSSAFDGYGSLYRMSQDGGWDEFLEWAVPRGLGRGMGAFRSEIRLLGGDTWVYRHVYLPAVLK